MFTLLDLKRLFPQFEGELLEENRIEQLMTDSREKVEHALFVPIVGERFDGHQFIEQAMENGAVAALWDRTKTIPTNAPKNFVFFLVDDTVKALQYLAKQYREEVNPIVIGITGSNGKTTTKDLVSSVLKAKYRTHSTQGNFNNEIGLPLTVLQMDLHTEVLILEMGMSSFGEIDLLTKIAQPDYAIITNIGESHIEHLGSRQGIAKAKLEIRNGLKEEGLLLIDGDEELLQPLKNEKNIFSIGFGKENDLSIKRVRLENQHTRFQLNNEQFEVPLLGEHHAKNATFAITIGKRLRLTTEEIFTGLNALQHTSMRFEWLTGKNGVTIINDAYNASPTSMKAAIEVLKQLTGFKKKIVVLGDILELGEYSESLHKTVADSIDTPIDIVYTYGTESEIISKEIRKTKQHIETFHFTEKDSLINKLQDHVKKDTVILFKASRGMKFEQFIEKIID